MNIIVDSKFDPYSYEELMRPIQNYDTAYRQLEDQYNTLATTAAALDSVSGDSRKTIDYYRGKLDEATESFNQGMSYTDRQNLRKLKRYFATTITPIITAEESRKKFVEERNKIQMSVMSNGDTIKFKNDNLTTDDFLQGKTPSNEYLSYNKIVQETATKSAALAQSLLTNDVIKKSLQMPGTFEITKNNGITPEVLFDIIKGTYKNLDPKSRKEADAFINLYNETMTKYNGWGQDAIDTAKSAVYTGLYAALNKPQTTYERDPSYTRPIDWAQYNLAKAREDRENKQWNIAMGIDPIWTDDNGIKYYTTPTGGVIPKDKDGNRVDMSVDDIKKALSGVKIDGLTIGGKRDSSEDKKEEEEEEKEKLQNEQDALRAVFGDGMDDIMTINEKSVPYFAFKFRLDRWDGDPNDFYLDDSNPQEYTEGKVQEYIRITDMPKDGTIKNDLINYISKQLYGKSKSNLTSTQKSQFASILSHIIIGKKSNTLQHDDGYVIFDYNLTQEQINALLGEGAAESDANWSPSSSSGNSAPGDTVVVGSGKPIDI